MQQAKPQVNQSNSFTELVKFKIDRQLEMIEDDMANTDFEKVIHDSLGRHYLKLFGRELFQVGGFIVHSLRYLPCPRQTCFIVFYGRKKIFSFGATWTTSKMKLMAMRSTGMKALPIERNRLD